MYHRAESSGTFLCLLYLMYYTLMLHLVVFTAVYSIFSYLTMYYYALVSMELAMSDLVEQSNLGSRMSQWKMIYD